MYKIFNSLYSSLKDITLIEASAGTGKTYTIVILYLRLLLGINGNKKYNKPLSVKNILVVTFTEAAANELRIRIKNYIYRLKLACLLGKSDDLVLSEILLQINCLKTAFSYLLIAEKEINEASIFTIHGFCQYILNNYALECNVLFDYTLIKNEFSLCQQSCFDFWRKYFNPLPYTLVDLLKQYWDSPHDLLKKIYPYLHKNIPYIYNSLSTKKTVLEQYVCFTNFINYVKKQWILHYGEILSILYASKVNNYIYNKRNVNIWLNNINLWSQKFTDHLRLPKELEKFRSSVLKKKTFKGETPPSHFLFILLDDLYQRSFLLYESVFIIAIKEIRIFLEKKKYMQKKLGFYDLINYIHQALSSKNKSVLSTILWCRYSVIMIDEFQDTDNQQYHIFKHFFKCKKKKNRMLLIGDPKQSIYGFRGADIYSYIRIRHHLDYIYTLNINYRSSSSMINAVNNLFQFHSPAFLLNKITFTPVHSVTSNKKLKLIIDEILQPALSIWLQPKETVNKDEYLQYMSCFCAITLYNWFNYANQGKAWIEKNGNKKILHASDITILVHDKNEAMLVKNALTDLMISSVYFSEYESVFTTSEAKELCLILEAVLTVNNKVALCTALATNLLGVNAYTIYYIKNNEYIWESYVKEFSLYYEYWDLYGFLPMLNKIMEKYLIEKKILITIDDERQLTNVFHIGELLQECYIKINNKEKLLLWLKQQIESPDIQSNNHQIRIVNDHNLIKIMTIYKSKGLEFPIVFFPFAACFRSQQISLLYNKKNYNSCMNLSNLQENSILTDEDRLSEDLRLLYVAVTRSIYHCSIGIASILHIFKKKSNVSDLHLSAIGYLVHQGKTGNFMYLKNQLKLLELKSNKDIVVFSTMPNKTILLHKEHLFNTNYIYKLHQYLELKKNPWQITSYTLLKKNTFFNKVEDTYVNDTNYDIHLLNNQQSNDINVLTPHSFTRGSLSGIFLHNLFKQIDFTKKININWLNDQFIKYNIDVKWFSMMLIWLEQIIHTPLNENGLSLFHISKENKCAELQFYLSINSIVDMKHLDNLLKKYDDISLHCSPLDSNKITGMLKGFIDLFFYWQGRYYLLDYKSNWLGNNDVYYNDISINQVMIHNRYDLQYNLYTLVLHRFLRHRLYNYKYERDFGGIFYLFLRGMNLKLKCNGIFFYKPKFNFISLFDKLFSNK